MHVLTLIGCVQLSGVGLKDRRKRHENKGGRMEGGVEVDG